MPFAAPMLIMWGSKGCSNLNMLKPGKIRIRAGLLPRFRVLTIPKVPNYRLSYNVPDPVPERLPTLSTESGCLAQPSVKPRLDLMMASTTSLISSMDSVT